MTVYEGEPVTRIVTLALPCTPPGTETPYMPSLYGQYQHQYKKGKLCVQQASHLRSADHEMADGHTKGSVDQKRSSAGL